MQLTTHKKIWISAGMLFLLLCAGLVGYVLIEGWSFNESLYMTVITLSTVGFQEVRPLSEAGRGFTVALVIVGIGVVGYGVANVTAFFIEGEINQLFRMRKMEKTIEKLVGHYIICGYGDEGRHAGEELARSKQPFVVIEKDAELASQLLEQGVLIIQGDATDDDTLLKAGVATARGLIAAVPEDADNVFVSLTARGFNPNLTIVARANDERTRAKLFRAGANKVILSAEIGGRRMASVLLRPKVTNFLDVFVHDDDLALRLEEIDILENSPFIDKTIRELQIRERTGVMVVAFHRPGQPIEINPDADSSLHPGDVLIVMGNDAQVEQLRHHALSPS